MPQPQDKLPAKRGDDRSPTARLSAQPRVPDPVDLESAGVSLDHVPAPAVALLTVHGAAVTVPGLTVDQLEAGAVAGLALHALVRRRVQVP